MPDHKNQCAYRYRVLAVLFALTAIWPANPTYAAISDQGRSYQGRSYQGRSYQGNDIQAAWLQGAELAGVLLGEDGSGHMVMTYIALDAFAGEFIRGRFFDTGAGTWESREFHASELIGFHWFEALCDAGNCVTVVYRIADVAQDSSTNTMPAHADNSDIWLFRIEYTTAMLPGSNHWRGVCAGDADGMGIFVNGRWSDSGSFDPQGYTFSCAGGVISKCTRQWGYKPWTSLVASNGQNVDLAPLHHACVRAARADYCGDGVSYTLDGTEIDMFDRFGLNVPEPVEGFVPEAGFDEHGAVWLEKTRYSLGTGNDQLPDALACTLPEQPEDEDATSEPALIEVWSHQAL